MSAFVHKSGAHRATLSDIGGPPSVSTENSTEQSPVVPEKPPISARKIQANRENSLKSTGPTSQAGKNRVRGNSYKHGLLAKALFRRPVDGEDAGEFYRFFKALRRDLQPVGMLEDTHLE